jgi:hypothetical protein
VFLDVPAHTYSDGLAVATWSQNDFFTQHWRAVPYSPVRPTSLGVHCPSKAVFGGVTFLDYGGAPYVTLSVDLAVSSDRRSLEARSRFRAERPVGTTLAVGDWVDVIYTAPAGRLIYGIEPRYLHTELSLWTSAAGPEFGANCNPGQEHEWFPGDGFVQRYVLIGDTGGTDVKFRTQWDPPDACFCDSQLRAVDFFDIPIVESAP